MRNWTQVSTANRYIESFFCSNAVLLFEICTKENPIIGFQLKSTNCWLLQPKMAATFRSSDVAISRKSDTQFQDDQDAPSMLSTGFKTGVKTFLKLYLSPIWNPLSFIFSLFSIPQKFRLHKVFHPIMSWDCFSLKLGSTWQQASSKFTLFQRKFAY